MPENEVDGEAFLLLKDDQIEHMIAAVGAQMKLMKKRDLLNALKSQVSFT